MHELGIGASAEDLRIAISKFLVQLAKRSNFCGTDESEVFGPEEIYLLLAGEALVGDGLESLFLVGVDRGYYFEIRELFSNGKHENSLRIGVDL
jgi:hypothetical protein